MKISHLSLSALVLVLSTPALAASDLTYVASNGVNTANVCTRTAPCLTMQFAHDQTNPGGTIIVLDTGSYGQITITKAITITAKGVNALMPSNGGVIRPILIQAGASDRVVLEGLTLDGLNLTNNAIRVETGAAIYVIDCTLKNTTGSGIFVTSTTANARVFVQRSNLFNNQYGIRISTNSTAGQVVSVLDSLIDGASITGVSAESGIIGMARSVINASPAAIVTSGSGQVISIGPSNVTSGTGVFNATIGFN